MRAKMLNAGVNHLEDSQSENLEMICFSDWLKLPKIGILWLSWLTFLSGRKDCSKDIFPDFLCIQSISEFPMADRFPARIITSHAIHDLINSFIGIEVLKNKQARS
jgi:hypothetical protein